MLLLGIDLGTSAIKVSVVDAHTQQVLATAQYPDTEAPIVSLQTGWAEQDPGQWWHDIKQCILKAHASGAYRPADIGAIGIAYQMHGLVVMDKAGQPLRHSIIWCDSRAVPYGQAAFSAIGQAHSLRTLLNSPGNFTAAKLAWVKEHEPDLYARIDKLMLPGDFIGYQFTGELTTSPAALSEGILWDFSQHQVATEVMNYFGFDASLIPAVQPAFSRHGGLLPSVAAELGLTAGTPVTYKAGDQPNNALSLNVMQPGEVATTAGTSGVIYGVASQVQPDMQSRLNCFAHVNHTATAPRIGLLLCINGCGIMNKMARQWLAPQWSYAAIDEMVASIPAGSEGVTVLPFGNGAERMLNNALPGAQLARLDLNRHGAAHLLRATQEGIAFAFRYGFDIMRSMGMQPQMIRAGKANMFQSQVFTDAFVNCTNTPVELYKTDGATGAALGAGIGAAALQPTDLGKGLELQGIVAPDGQQRYEEAYQRWLTCLQQTVPGT
ncbi:MAG: FGGY family carbohydrate kinase [Chitinophagaceae bacterium]|nr:FGGY family carbohydrate kinase [Chitinophagaceae bacterium]